MLLWLYKNALNIGVRWLILDKTGFTRWRFFTSYFIDGRVFFRIFTFYIVLNDLFLNCLVRVLATTGDQTAVAYKNACVRDINLLPKRHLVWRDSVGVKSSGSGIKSECADIFYQSLISGCYAILTSPKEGETAVCGYNPALFWVLSVSCWCFAELIFT